MRNIAFRSMCMHHLLPFRGFVHIAYVPGPRLAGLGALPRVVDTLASRPQMQEYLGEEIADTLSTSLGAVGVMVMVEATHGCVAERGSRQATTSALTIATRGVCDETTLNATLVGVLRAAED